MTKALKETSDVFRRTVDFFFCCLMQKVSTLFFLVQATIYHWIMAFCVWRKQQQTKCGEETKNTEKSKPL